MIAEVAGTILLIVFVFGFLTIATWAARKKLGAAPSEKRGSGHYGMPKIFRESIPRQSHTL